MRCLALAQALQRAGCRVTFISRRAQDHLIDRVRGAGIETLELPQVSHRAKPGLWLGASEDDDARQTAAALASLGEPVAWLVADNFGIGAAWERRVRPAVRCMLTLDDRLEFDRACDALLYPQAITPQTKPLLERHRAAGIRVFAGPQFFILPQRIEQARASAKPRDGIPENVLVAFGGATKADLAASAVTAVRNAGSTATIHLVLGTGGLHAESFRRQLADVPNLRVYDHVERIEELYAKCELAIGSDGIMQFERCLLGLPSIVVPVETHWAWSARALQEAGCVLTLRDADHVTGPELRAAVASIVNDPKAVGSMSAACLRYMAAHEPLDGGALVRFLLTGT